MANTSVAKITMKLNNLRQLRDGEVITSAAQMWSISEKGWITCRPDLVGKRYNPDTMPLLRCNAR